MLNEKYLLVLAEFWSEKKLPNFRFERSQNLLGQFLLVAPLDSAQPRHVSLQKRSVDSLR